MLTFATLIGRCFSFTRKRPNTPCTAKAVLVVPPQFSCALEKDIICHTDQHPCNAIEEGKAVQMPS